MIRFLLLVLAGAWLQGELKSQCIIVDSAGPICQGANATLGAHLQPGCMNGTNSYSFEVIPFAPQPLVSDTAIDPEFRNNLGQISANHDDVWAGPYPIGFTFCFLGQIFRAYWVGSNGWISFTDPYSKGWTIFTPFSIPSTAAAIPKNAIFAPYQDWNPSIGSGGPARNKVFRHVISDPPNNSKLVVYWDSCALYGCSTAIGVFQIVLNQSDYSIENNITVKPLCNWQTNNATQGVHNSDGTIAFTAFNRNATSWTTSNESTRFVPNGITWYKDAYPGGTIAGYGPSIIVSPMVTTNYFAVIANCVGTSTESARVNVRVLPTPTLSGPATACLNTTQKYFSEPGMTNYIWRITGGVIAGGGTATSDTVLVTWNSLSGTHEVGIKYTDPVSGCTALTEVVKSVTILSLPLPSIISGISPVCPGDTGNLYVADAGKQNYSWTVSSGGQITSGGGPADNWIKATWNVSGTEQVSVIYTEPSTGCTAGIPGTFGVTVKPLPDVIYTPLNPSALWCSSDTVKVDLSSTMTGATFTWSSSANPALISPSSVVNRTGNIRQKYQNSGTSPEPVNFQARATANGCTSQPYPFSVQVNPVPGVSCSSQYQYICPGGTSLPVTLSSPTTSTTFTWAYPCSGPVTPCPGSGSGNTIPAMTLNNPASVMNQVIITATASLGSCLGTTAIHTIYINPKPAVNNSPMSQNACLGTPTTPVSLSCSVLPAQYQWSASPSHPSIGGFITGTQSSAVIPSQTLTDPLNIPGFVTYSITPSIFMNSLTCYGDVADYLINTKPSPVLNITGPVPSLACEGGSNDFSVVNDPGTVYTWSLNPSSIGALTSPQGLSTATFSWNGNGNGILASVSAVSAYGCSSSSFTSFLIRPKPLVSMTLCIDPVTTPEAKPYVLSGGKPTGASGTYSGTGVSFSGGKYYFDPAAVPSPLPKTVAITYTFVNMYNCPASDVKSVQVVSPPPFQCGNNSVPLQDVRTSPRKTYTTYLRGGRCWMTVNLNYGSSRSWTQPLTNNCIPEKYCAQNDTSCNVYGGFYPWDEMMQYQVSSGDQGACPPGWHVPSMTEWQALIDDPANQGNGLAGGFLKDVPFSAKTGGVLFLNDLWAFIPSASVNATMFWTSTPNTSGKAFARGISIPNTSTSLYSSARANAFQVRCVRD